MVEHAESPSEVVRVTHAMIHGMPENWLISGIAADGSRQSYALDIDWRADTDRALAMARDQKTAVGEILIVPMEAGDAGSTQRAAMIRIGNDENAFEAISTKKGNFSGFELSEMFDKFEQKGRQEDHAMREERRLAEEARRMRESFASSRKGLSDMADRVGDGASRDDAFREANILHLRNNSLSR